MQQRAAILVLAVVALASTTGCLRKKKKPIWSDTEITSGSWGIPSATPDKNEPSPSTFTASWTDTGTLHVTELPRMYLSASIKGTTLSITSTLPKGVKLEVDGKPVSGGIDIAPAFGSMTPKQVFDYQTKVDSKKTLHFTFADGKSFDTTVPALSTYDFGRQLSEQTKNGQTTSFGEGDQTAPKQHSALILDTYDHPVVGPAKTMKDVDWYVLTEAQEARETKKICDGYKSYTKNDGEHAYPLELVDSKVTIVNRRTGETVDEKTFTAPSTCPYMTTHGRAQSTVGSTAIVGWLRTRRTKN